MIPATVMHWLRGVGARFSGGARDERGAVAVVFAVSIVLLAPLALGVIDIYLSSSQRTRLQDALDAAALYTARTHATTDEELSAIGQRALNANLSAREQARLVDSSFSLVDSTVVASAEMESQGFASQLWNHGTMKVSTNVVRASANLEVSLVLDITGSMGGSRISSLKTAAKDLIDLVVQDQQTPYYSKVAIVPYANAVNVGSHLDDVRGAVPDAVSITGATRERPVKITARDHGFSDGDMVYIDGVHGMRELNDETYKVATSRTNTFKLKTPDGDRVDGRYWDSYSYGGEAVCADYGCERYYFTDNSNRDQTFEAADCVSERTGVDKYTDAAPDDSPVGFVYTSDGGGCPSAEIVPLSSDKTALKQVITDLSAGGTTAGHIGLAWGWYMVSPNFGYLWDDAASQPAAYGTDELLKAVVLMTDGEFNTAYCGGVVAKNYGSGTRANCNAENGSPYTQAKALCDAMKQKDIVIYTVGFGISSGSSAANLLTNCATDSDHEYLPASGQDLQDAFQAIGQDINSLRLSH